MAMKKFLLTKELGLILIIKIIVLYLIWLVFFSSPPTKSPAFGNTLFEKKIYD